MTTQPFDGAINSKRILVVAAHPDDEVLAVGAPSPVILTLVIMYRF